MTEDKFIQKFQPEKDSEGNVYVQRDLPEDRELILKAMRTRRLWTMIEAEEHLYLVPGFHYVNRMYYVICKKPCKNENIEVRCY